MMNDGYIHYQLSACQRERELVSIFVDEENPDDFIAGFVAHLNQRQVALCAVSPVGHYDGLIAVNLSGIGSVLGEDEYAERLRCLIALRGERPVDTLDVRPNEDIFHALCRKSMEEGRVVSIWSGESEFAGVVTDVNDLFVTLDALDFFGHNPEQTVLALREIDMVSFGAEDELMFELLKDNPLPAID